MPSIALILATAAVVLAAAAQNPHHHRRTVADVHPAIARGEWRRHDGLTAALGDKSDTVHKVWVSLKQRNLDVLEKKFWSVSNPRSTEYGQYLSKDEVAAIVAPNPKVVELITEWLQAEDGEGVVTVDFTYSRDAALVTLPLSRVEHLFGVEMHAYTPSPALLLSADTVLYRSNRPPVLPAHIAEHVTLTHGIHDFPPITKRQASRIRAARNAAATSGPALKKATLAAGVPVFQRARGRDGSVQAWVTPVCMDGQAASTIPAGGVCSDHSGGALSSMSITAQTTINPTPAKYQASLIGANSTNCDIESGAVVCHLSVPAAYYDAYTTTVWAYFGGAPFSATNANVVANIPPVTPQKLWDLYRMGGNPRTSTNVTQCVVEFEQQYASLTDLELFFTEMGIVNDAPVTIIGPNDQSNPGGEAALDIEWIMAMAPGAPTTLWSIAANSTVEIDDILTWSYAIGNTTNPPQVNSLSYGMTEGNVNTYQGAGYIERSDVEFQKLALMGLTIIIADGDTGAGDLGGPPMGNNDCNTLHPDWPSQSPFVTAVGSTYITPNAEPICYYPPSQGGIDCSHGPDGEVGVALNFGIHWTTGGGFSNVQGQAPYQSDVVQNYLAMGSAVLPPANMFNASGRAYPDVVTCGHNLITALSGTFASIDGTSASAPIFAGLVTMWNDARVAAGKSVLGFLNQMLYALPPTAFRDVLIADNHCGGEGDTCCSTAFKGAVGWDAVTGNGSPLWDEVAAFVLALP